jgi:type I restriction enzyme R subunit
MVSTSFWSADGMPISTEQFLQNMFGALPQFFKDENELRQIWSNPTTRKVFLDKIAMEGFEIEQLETLQKMVDAENSDLFDVLAYIAFTKKPITRMERIENTKYDIFEGLDHKHKEFVEFVLAKYQERGVEELDEEKLPDLLNLKYHSISDAEKLLGGVDNIRTLFFNFQKNLYSK